MRLSGAAGRARPWWPMCLAHDRDEPSRVGRTGAGRGSRGPGPTQRAGRGAQHADDGARGRLQPIPATRRPCARSCDTRTRPARPPATAADARRRFSRPTPIPARSRRSADSISSSRERRREAVRAAYTRALELDPANALALAGLGRLAAGQRPRGGARLLRSRGGSGPLRPRTEARGGEGPRRERTSSSRPRSDSTRCCWSIPSRPRPPTERARLDLERGVATTRNARAGPPRRAFWRRRPGRCARAAQPGPRAARRARARREGNGTRSGHPRSQGSQAQELARTARDFGPRSEVIPRGYREKLFCRSGKGFPVARQKQSLRASSPQTTS